MAYYSNNIQSTSKTKPLFSKTIRHVKTERNIAGSTLFDVYKSKV